MDNPVNCNVSNNDDPRNWCLKSFQMNHMVVCYEGSLSHNDTIWRAENAAKYALPAFLLQMILIISITRPLMAAFKYMRLPRITAEILGGVIITVLGRPYIFPVKSVMTLETIANLGLLFYVFLWGLEVDVKPIIQAPKKAFSIALAGFLVPFPVGYGLNYLMVNNINPVHLNKYPTLFGPLFWGIALSTSNFSELAQILSDFKLLRSEVGRTSISAAMITDSISWVLLILSMGVVNNGKVYTSVLAAAFVLFMLFVMRPALAWVVTRTSQNIESSGGYNDYHISFILIFIVICGYVTDICGCRSFLGGFMLGIIIPKGDLKEKLMEKVGAFVPSFMMPLFFCLIGLRTTFVFLFDQFSFMVIFTVLILAFVVKILSTFVVAVFVNKDSIKDGLALGVLMNTKGLLSLIIICSARDYKVLDNQTFTILIMALWLMTVAVGPILNLLYRSNKRDGGDCGIQPTIASLEPDSDFQVLTCFHTARELPGIVNLLHISNPTRNSPINVSAVHLVENLGRTSAVRIVINNDSNDDFSGHFTTLKFNKEPGTIAVETLTVVSEYTTMHVDVCTLAREHSANLVVLPFNLRSSGGTEDSLATAENNDCSAVANAVHNPLRGVNKNIMERIGCSLAVLVDRGTRPPIKDGYRGHSHVLMIFIGGPDDREALEYAGRMSGTPGLSLTIARFMAGEEAAKEDLDNAEKMLDDRCMEEICAKTKENKLVDVMTTEVRDGDEIVKMVMAMDGGDYNLVVVGRGRSGRVSSLISPESEEWSEFPELGSLGDSLVCSNFAENAWILVVQQGDG